VTTILIGELLRKTRSKRGFELEQVELATTIPLKHLAALESERFDEFPGKAYTRSFLREYATFLELDPQPLLEELDLRLGESEPGPIMLVPGRHSDRPVWALLVAACVLVIALVSWQVGSGSHEHALARAHSTHLAKPAPHPRAPATSATRWVKLVLVASHGPCWLFVHAGSNTGPVLYENTLQQTGTLSFARKQFWIRLGAPWNLEARLNGQPVSLPFSPGPINVVITTAGVKAV
jgi:hypothetical protein